MSCAACQARVERAVSSLDGVATCDVNLLTGEMQVTGSATDGEIIAAVVGAGYGASADGGAEREMPDEAKPILVRFLVSLLPVLALMYFSMGNMLGAPMPQLIIDYPALSAVIQMVLATAVMLINHKFFVSGVKGVISLTPNMDTLVSLGSFASFGYSVYLTVRMLVIPAEAAHLLHSLYFESAAMILVLISLGKLLEAKAKGRTTDALRSLLLLKPKTATVLKDGAEIVVPIDAVRPGDVLVVRAGDSIPTDARIILGEGSLDEAMLTGESLPVDKAVGADVFGATRLLSGYMHIEVTSVGEETALSNIIRMVKEASSSKAPIAKLADKVSGVFVPVVLGISLLTLVGWLIAEPDLGYAVGRAISVLVISCPCALGLATPTAIMVGSGVGAKAGVLFKNATALEAVGRIDTVVLDKTGTITKGEPSVTDVIGDDEKQLITLAYSLEYYSEHPLARAVVRYAESLGGERVELSGFATMAGRGVSAKLDGKELLAASLGATEDEIGVPDALKNRAEALAEEGKTPLCFSYGGEVIGIIAVADTIKDDAPEAVAEIKRMGLNVVMLTGDNETTARAIAASVGIDEVRAGVLPDGKESVIRELQSIGHKALMVGDGINDAPALTRADAGMAIGCGTDIAIEAADVVVMREGLFGVSDAISVGRATLRNIKQNLLWAFLYNVIGIPMAAGLFGLALDPMFGALAMSLSSFSVVLNALRLGLWQSRKKKPLNVTEVDQNDEKLDTDTTLPINTDQNQKTETENTMTKIISVEGMMCPHCEARVKKVLEVIDGVSLATPSHTDKKVVVELSAPTADEVLIAAITDAGYEVQGIE